MAEKTEQANHILSPYSPHIVKPTYPSNYLGLHMPAHMPTCLFDYLLTYPQGHLLTHILIT